MWGGSSGERDPLFTAEFVLQRCPGIGPVAKVDVRIITQQDIAEIKLRVAQQHGRFTAGSVS